MRIFLFIAFILLLVAGWFAGWFFVAGQVETVIDDVKRKLADNHQTLDCSNQQITGFPFRISLNCDSLVYADSENGVSLSTGRLRSAAQAYQPNRAVAEIEAPANLTLPGNQRFQTRWSSMRTSMTAGLTGPTRISLSGKDLAISPAPENPQLATSHIDGFQFHGRRNGDNAVDLAINIDNAKTETGPWPDYDLLLDMRMEDIYADLLQRTDLIEIARQKGLKGEIHNLHYSALEGGSATISGPMNIDTQGRLSGKFQVTVSQLPALLDALALTFPDKQEDIDKASGVLDALAGQGKNAEFKLPVVVKNGTVIIGLFPVGEIPPLY
ncbi:MAG: DUF2125 domain-containing protein [Rhizobiaceae bacterium]|nr:DUF2125 domain-containing protein [Rhizobiaceae bacterium]